jgi:hypothetical protein
VTVPALLIIVLGFEALSMGVFEIIRGFQGSGVGAFILGVINPLIGRLLLVRPWAPPWRCRSFSPCSCSSMAWGC